MSSSKGDNSQTRPHPTLFTYPHPPGPVVGLVVVGGFFLCFIVVYLCKYCFINVRRMWIFYRAASNSLVRPSSINASSSSPNTGLDPSLLQSFPTFLYSSIKNLRPENLECAICLVEFEEKSMMRLLSLCCHVFHQQCIDLWLGSNKTCPVCRRDLDSPVETTDDDDCVEDQDERIVFDDVFIEVKEGHDDGDHQVHDDVDGKRDFVKSHSTGHSMLIKGHDKYTLRLPENVAFKVFRGKHGYTKSCSD